MWAAQWHSRQLWNLRTRAFKVPGFQLLSMNALHVGVLQVFVSFQLLKLPGRWIGSDKL